METQTVGSRGMFQLQYHDAWCTTEASDNTESSSLKDMSGVQCCKKTVNWRGQLSLPTNQILGQSLNQKN